MAKVLVTGASGFIGTHLVAALAEPGRRGHLSGAAEFADRIAAAGGRPLRVRRRNRPRQHRCPRSRARRSSTIVAGCTQALAPRDFYRVNQRGVANVAQACAGANHPAGAGLRLLAGRGRSGQRRRAEDRSRSGRARVALRPQQAGGRAGRRALRRPRPHHHRPPADRPGRGRPAGLCRCSAPSPASASTWCRGSTGGDSR